MAEAVYLPKIGMTMEDAVLTRWLVPDGATVSHGDSIFEMDIEKVLQDVEAEADGILRYLVGDCVRLRPGAVVACLLADGEEVPAALLEQVASQWSEPAEEYRTVGATPAVPTAATATAAPTTGASASTAPSEPAEQATETAPTGRRVAASPSVRRLARELGVDLEQVLQATGSGDRITDDDVRAYAATTARPTEGPDVGRVIASPIARRLARELGVDLRSLSGSGPRGRIVEADVRDAAASGSAGAVPVEGADAVASPSTAEDAVSTAPVVGVPYTGRRRAIGERMARSLRDSAQLTLTSEIRVDDAVRMAGGLSREWRADRTVVTLTILVIRAAALALREHPRLNSRLEDGLIVGNSAINIGFAADAAEGLMVPVIRDAASRPLQEVADDFVRLSRETEANELDAIDVTDGTFTVTSLESTDIDAFTPIINPPQAAILGLGRVRRQPVVGEGGIEVGRVTTLSLTIDHRISDGEPAARFLGRIGQLLERPYLLA